MEDITKIDKPSTGENELTPSHDHVDAQPVNSDLPDWYIDLVLQAMERTGEDLTFYLYGTTEKTYEARKAAVERRIAAKNSNAKENTTEQPENPALDFHKRMIERAKKIPQEERDMFPPDFTENLDHYLYGTPKKSP